MHLPRIRPRIAPAIAGVLLLGLSLAGVAYGVSTGGIPSYLRAQQLTLGFGSPNAVLTNCSGALCVNGSPPGKTILTAQCGPDNGATACTSRTSNATLACDPALSISVASGKNYAVTGYVDTGGSTTGGGFKVSLGGGALPRDALFVVNNNTSTALVSPLAQSFSNVAGAFGEAYGCNGCAYVVQITAWVSAASNTTLCIQTAQNTSNASATSFSDAFLQAVQMN